MKLLDKFVLKQKWLLLFAVLITTGAAAAFYSPPTNADAEALRKQKAKIELKKSQGQEQNTKLRDTPPVLLAANITTDKAGDYISAVGSVTGTSPTFNFNATVNLTQLEADDEDYDVTDADDYEFVFTLEGKLESTPVDPIVGVSASAGSITEGTGITPITITVTDPTNLNIDELKVTVKYQKKPAQTYTVTLSATGGRTNEPTVTSDDEGKASFTFTPTTYDVNKKVVVEFNVTGTEYSVGDYVPANPDALPPTEGYYPVNISQVTAATVATISYEDITIPVTVTADEDNVTISNNPATATQGATYTFQVARANGVLADGTWEITYGSDGEIPVYSGTPGQPISYTVSGNSPYTFTITGITEALALASGSPANFQVKVKYTAPHTVRVSTSTTGVIVTTGNSPVVHGGNYIFNVTIDGLPEGSLVFTTAAGVVLDVNSTPKLELTDNTTGEYTISNVRSDLDIIVTYAVNAGTVTINPVNLTAEEVNGGTLEVTFTDGTAEFNVTPTVKGGTVNILGTGFTVDETSGWSTTPGQEGVYNVKLVNIAENATNVTVEYVYPPYVYFYADSRVTLVVNETTITNAQTGVYVPGGNVTVTATVVTATNYQLILSVNGTISYPGGETSGLNTSYSIPLTGLQDRSSVNVTYEQQPQVTVARPVVGSGILISNGLSLDGLAFNNLNNPITGYAEEETFTFYAKPTTGLSTDGTISVIRSDYNQELVGKTNEPKAEFTYDPTAGAFKITVTGVTSDLNLTVSYVARPTVTITTTNDNDKIVWQNKTQGPAEADGTFYFEADISQTQLDLKNGKFVLDFVEDESGDHIDLDYTARVIGGNGRYYSFTLAGVTKATTVTISYKQLPLTYTVVAEAGSRDTSFTAAGGVLANQLRTDTGGFTVTATLNTNYVTTGGKVTFALYEVTEVEGEDVLTVYEDATVTATVVEGSDGEDYSIKVTMPTGNKGIDELKVEVAYLPNPPAAVPVPKPIYTLPSLDIDDIREGEIAVGGKGTNSTLISEGDYYLKGSVVPGGSVNTTVTVDANVTSPTPQTVTVNFNGALALVRPSITVYNVLVNVTVINIVYVFDSSTKSVIPTRTGLRAASDGDIWAEFDAETHTLYIHLVDIDVDALGGEETRTVLVIENAIGEEFEFPADRDVTLYDQPITLIPDNGVPSIGYSGYFTLGGTYPTDGQLLYKVGDDGWKEYRTGISNSEIARLATGEYLYFALKGATSQVSGVFIYKPKTYDNVGGGDGGSYIPSLPRNVFISATGDSEALLTFNPGSGQGITTDGNFTFTVTPTQLIPGYEISLLFYKDWITISNPPTYSGHETPDVNGVFTITLTNIKVSDLQVVVGYRQGVANDKVEADKVWANGNTLFINSNTNGTAKVYSIAGALVKTVKVEANTLTTAELPQGTYIITLNGKTTKVNTK